MKCSSPTCVALKLTSLPSRERGLKCVECWMDEFANGVAPLAGAWIEITEELQNWILILSLPSRERGLKSTVISGGKHPCGVAPLAGAWIEIKIQ